MSLLTSIKLKQNETTRILRIGEYNLRNSSLSDSSTPDNSFRICSIVTFGGVSESTQHGLTEISGIDPCTSDGVFAGRAFMLCSFRQPMVLFSSSICRRMTGVLECLELSVEIVNRRSASSSITGSVDTFDMVPSGTPV